MGGKKTVECSRRFEKVRRDKLNVAFGELCKLLPDHDPSIILSKMEILKKAAEYIKNLQEQNHEIMKFGNDTVLKNETERLKKRVAHLLLKTKELVDVLRGAGIEVPKDKKKKKTPSLGQSVSDESKKAAHNNGKTCSTNVIKKVKCGCIKLNGDKEVVKEANSVTSCVTSAVSPPRAAGGSTVAEVALVQAPTIVNSARVVAVSQSSVIGTPVYATRLQTIPLLNKSTPLTSVNIVATSCTTGVQSSGSCTKSTETITQSTLVAVTQNNIITRPVMTARLSTIPIIDKRIISNNVTSSTCISSLISSVSVSSPEINNLSSVLTESSTIAVAKPNIPTGLQTVPLLEKKILSNLGPGTLILADGRIVNVPPVMPQILVKPQPTVILMPSTQKREKLIIPKSRDITRTTFANKAPIPAIKAFRPCPKSCLLRKKKLKKSNSPKVLTSETAGKVSQSKKTENISTGGENTQNTESKNSVQPMDVGANMDGNNTTTKAVAEKISETMNEESGEKDNQSVNIPNANNGINPVKSPANSNEQNGDPKMGINSDPLIPPATSDLASDGVIESVTSEVVVGNSSAKSSAEIGLNRTPKKHLEEVVVKGKIVETSSSPLVEGPSDDLDKAKKQESDPKEDSADSIPHVRQETQNISSMEETNVSVTTISESEMLPKQITTAENTNDVLKNGVQKIVSNVETENYFQSESSVTVASTSTVSNTDIVCPVYDSSLSMTGCPSAPYASTASYGPIGVSVAQNHEQLNVFDITHMYTPSVAAQGVNSASHTAYNNTVAPSTKSGELLNVSRSSALQTSSNQPKNIHSYNSSIKEKRPENNCSLFSSEQVLSNTASTGYTFPPSDVFGMPPLSEKSVQTTNSSLQRGAGVAHSAPLGVAHSAPLGVAHSAPLPSNYTVTTTGQTSPMKPSTSNKATTSYNSLTQNSPHSSSMSCPTQKTSQYENNGFSMNSIPKPPMSKEVSEHHLTYCTISMPISSNFNLPQPSNMNTLSLKNSVKPSTSADNYSASLAYGGFNLPQTPQNNGRHLPPQPVFNNSDGKSAGSAQNKKYPQMSSNSFLSNSFIPPPVSSIDNYNNTFGYSSSLSVGEPISHGQNTRFPPASSVDNVPGLYGGCNQSSSTSYKRSVYSQSSTVNSFSMSKPDNNFNISTPLEKVNPPKQNVDSRSDTHLNQFVSCSSYNVQTSSQNVPFTQTYCSDPVVTTMVDCFRGNYNPSELVPSQSQSYLLNSSMHLNHPNSSSSLIYNMPNRNEDRNVYPQNKYSHNSVERHHLQTVPNVANSTTNLEKAYGSAVPCLANAAKSSHSALADGSSAAYPVNVNVPSSSGNVYQARPIRSTNSQEVQTNPQTIYKDSRRNSNHMLPNSSENQNKGHNTLKTPVNVLPSYNNEGQPNHEKMSNTKYPQNSVHSLEERNSQQLSVNSLNRKDISVPNSFGTPSNFNEPINNNQQFTMPEIRSQTSKSVETLGNVQRDFNYYVVSSNGKNQSHMNQYTNNSSNTKSAEIPDKNDAFNRYSKTSEEAGSENKQKQDKYSLKSVQKSTANVANPRLAKYAGYNTLDSGNCQNIVSNQQNNFTSKSAAKVTASEEAGNCTTFTRSEPLVSQSASTCVAVSSVSSQSSLIASSVAGGSQPGSGGNQCSNPVGKIVPVSVVMSSTVQAGSGDKHYTSNNEVNTDFLKSKDIERNTFIPIIDDVRLTSDFSNDLFSSLQVPTGGQHSESISPTAAFLLAFPLVSTSKNVENTPENENHENHTSTPTTILQIGNIDPPNTELFHSVDYQKSNKHSETQYILSSEYLQLNETPDKQSSGYNKRCEKRKDNFSGRPPENKQKSKTTSIASNTFTHSYSYPMLSCSEYQYSDKDNGAWQQQHQEYQQPVGKEGPKKPCERKKDKGVQKGYYYQNYQEYYNYKDKKRKQQNRISVNWMSASENREGEYPGKEVEPAGSTFGGGAPQNVYSGAAQLDIPLEPFAEFGPPKKTNNYSWSPSKSLLPALDTHLILPSTLPTLVGDLALGTSTPSESYKTFETSKNPPQQKKTPEKQPEESKKRSECHKNQGNFFSVSQLVDPKSKKQKTSDKNCKRQDKNVKQRNNVNCTKRKDDHCMYYEEKNNFVPISNQSPDKRPPYKGGNYSAESLIGLQQNEMEFPANFNYQQNSNYFQNDFTPNMDTNQQYGYFQQGPFTGGFPHEEYQDWNNFGANQRGTEQNKQKSGRKEDTYQGPPAGILQPPQIQYPPYSKNLHYSTNLSSANALNTNTTTTLTNFNLSTIFPEMNDQRVATSGQTQQMNQPFPNQQAFRSHLS